MGLLGGADHCSSPSGSVGLVSPVGACRFGAPFAGLLHGSHYSVYGAGVTGDLTT